VTRWRRPGAREILLAYLVFAFIGSIVGWLSRLHDLSYWLTPFLLTVFLAWRVSRGGYVARAILIVLATVSCATAVLAVARLWDAAVVAGVITSGVQVALLLSPPVYGRTRRPARVEARMPGWSWLLRRPPVWLLSCGLLAGGLVTMACLGHMDWVTVTACRPTTSDPCTALTEGYPLPWLTARQDMPEIVKRALLRDFTQWALASTSLLYLAWLWLTAPDDRAGQALPGWRHPGRPSPLAVRWLTSRSSRAGGTSFPVPGW
jgi:hypothetical protein